MLINMLTDEESLKLHTEPGFTEPEWMGASAMSAIAWRQANPDAGAPVFPYRRHVDEDGNVGRERDTPGGGGIVIFLEEDNPDGFKGELARIDKEQS